MRTRKTLAQRTHPRLSITSTERAMTAEEIADAQEERRERERERPSWDRSVPEDAGRRHFTCELAYEDDNGRRTMPVDFHMGSALTGEPDAATVLDCVLSDVAGVENARDYYEWCDEYGMRPSRRTQRMYDTIKRQAEQVRTLLGRDFNLWLNAEGL